MADHYIENEMIRIGINNHGAELVSLVKKADGHEYMWSGDPKCWNRVSPVLFPFVGKLNGLQYTFEGKAYANVPQHGYARDCDFVLSEKLEDTIRFELCPDELFKERYPFDFKLILSYRLEGSTLHVMWEVQNMSDKTMYFSIGGHPAFLTYNGDAKDGYIVDLGIDKDELVCGEINEKGLLKSEERSFALSNGKLTLSEAMFDKDALIIDSDEIHEATLCKRDGTPYLRLNFDVPQLGIWSPAGKNAPFVCIEPWYGRCDRVDFAGDLQDREYGNVLKAGEVFDREYTVEVL